MMTTPNNAPKEESPFHTAVISAIATTDIAQEDLFNRMLGKPGAAPQVAAPKRRKKNEQRNMHTTTEEKDGMPIVAFEHMVIDDVDYNKDGISPRMLRESLDDFRSSFAERVTTAPDFDSLCKTLEAFVTEEHARLFFKTNDYMSASIKEDYFSQFLEALITELSDSKLLGETQLDRLEALREMYDMGLRSYNMVGEQLHIVSEGYTRSLLHYGEEVVAAAKERGETKTLEQAAQEGLGDILLKNYGLKPKDVPSPYLMILAQKSDLLARSQLKAIHPNMDFRDPELMMSDEYTDRYLAVVATWAEHVKKNPGIQSCYQVYKGLLEQIRLSDNIPENFPELIGEAMQAAKDATENQLRTLYLDHQLMVPHDKPQTHKITEAVYPSYESMEAVTSGFHRFVRSVESVPEGGGKYELLETLEGAMEKLGDDMTFNGNHPAVALAAKEYMAVFRKHLGEALHKTGRGDMKLLSALKELEEKADYLHENSKAIGEWLMRDTDGGHDTMFHYMLLLRGGKSMPLSNDDIQRLSDHGVDCLRTMAEDRGIAPSLSSVQCVPLIYNRCLDIARGELERMQAMNIRSLYFKEEGAPALKGKKFAAALKKKPLHSTWEASFMQTPSEDKLTLKEKQHADKAVHQRALLLFHQAMTRLVPQGITMEVEPEEVKEAKKTGEPEAEHEMPDIMYPIEMTAHNLRLTFEYLDSIDRHRSTMHMH